VPDDDEAVAGFGMSLRPDPGTRRYVAVAEEILGAIGAGRLSPGDRLPNERELATICHASRPTVRDAILALELFGVVEVRPGSGCYVTTHGAARRTGSAALRDSPPRELLEAREQIEPAVARLCAGHVSPDEVARLADLIDRCEAEGSVAAPDQLEVFLQLSHQFHHALALNCGNSIMADMTRQLVDVTAHPLWMVVNGLHVRSPEARAVQIAVHRDILGAIADGDPTGAAAAMTAHLGALSERIFGRTRSTRTIVRQRRRGGKVV
jgi:GntR family transcriptional repressor for pyruvate dehydrogenase complex